MRTLTIGFVHSKMSLVLCSPLGIRGIMGEFRVLLLRHSKDIKNSLMRKRTNSLISNQYGRDSQALRIRRRENLLRLYSLAIWNLPINKIRVA